VNIKLGVVLALIVSMTMTASSQQSKGILVGVKNEKKGVVVQLLMEGGRLLNNVLTRDY
jgi:hypothetical protein